MAPRPIDMVCAAAREHGMQYGAYVAAGMPGYEEYEKRLLGDAAPKKRVIKKIPYVCQFCGREFLASRISQKYCCRKCREMGEGKVLSDRPEDEKRVCKVCGKPIPPGTHGNKIYCIECADEKMLEHKRERLRAWRARQKEA